MHFRSGRGARNTMSKGGKKGRPSRRMVKRALKGKAIFPLLSEFVSGMKGGGLEQRERFLGKKDWR